MIATMITPLDVCTRIHQLFWDSLAGGLMGSYQPDVGDVQNCIPSVLTNVKRIVSGTWQQITNGGHSGKVMYVYNVIDLCLTTDSVWT
jgi:hypothetical protein